MVELTAMGASRRLGVSLCYVYRMLWMGRLPGRKENGVWLIPEAAIEAKRVAVEERRKRIARR